MRLVPSGITIDEKRRPMSRCKLCLPVGLHNVMGTEGDRQRHLGITKHPPIQVRLTLDRAYVLVGVRSWSENLRTDMVGLKYGNIGCAAAPGVLLN